MSQFHGFAVDGFDLTGADADGCEWSVENVRGWFTGAAVRTSTEARMQQDGDWRGQTYRAGRVITLQGKVFAPDTTALEGAARRLSSLLPTWGEFVGSSPAGELSAVVQLEDEPLFDALSDRGATWQLTVASESPLLFGAAGFAQTTLAESAGGSGLTYPLAYPLDYGVAPGVTPGVIALPNEGTASYHPRVRIDGPVTNPVVTLQETGDSIRYLGTVAAGQHIDLNWGQVRRVTIGDNPVSVRHLTTIVGNSLAVPVGGGSLSISADSAGDGALLSAWFYQGAWV